MCGTFFRQGHHTGIRIDGIEAVRIIQAVGDRFAFRIMAGAGRYRLTRGRFTLFRGDGESHFNGRRLVVIYAHTGAGGRA